MSGSLDEVSPIRLYDFETICGTSENKTYPVEFEISKPHELRVKNQMTTGMCVAETIAQISEAYYGKEMSEGQAYVCFRDDNHKGYGLFPSQSLKYWTEKSTIPRQYFDIVDEMPNIGEKYKQIPELDGLFEQYKIKGFAALNYADRKIKDNSIKEALTTIAKDYGLVAVSKNYFTGGSHCIWLTGWNDNKGKYKFKNSWGDTYGDNGFSEIPKEQVNEVYLVFFEDIQLPFKDVHENDWSFPAIKNMYCSGLIKGITENSFAPKDYVTREQLCAIIDRLCSRIEKQNAVLSKLISIKDA